MTPEQRKQIDILNDLFFTEFGRTADGRLFFKWMRTDEMPVEFLRGIESNFDANKGLYLARRTFKKRTFAETHGHGLCWTVAMLETPSRETWIWQNGPELPWPANGYYRPVDCICLRIENLPDENVSIRAAFNIRRTFEIFSMGPERAQAYFEDQTRADTNKHMTDIDKEIGDMLDDATPAFKNNPGGKTHVSLPS